MTFAKGFGEPVLGLGGRHTEGRENLAPHHSAGELETVLRLAGALPLPNAKPSSTLRRRLEAPTNPTLRLTVLAAFSYDEASARHRCKS